MAVFSNGNASGSNSAKTSTVAAKGAGFNVVYNKASIPTTASDYTPYVQQLMTANNGKPAPGHRVPADRPVHPDVDGA